MSIEIAKKMITGIFDMNHQLAEIDDEIFIQIIKSGIEEASDGDQEIHDVLLEHAIKQFEEIWLEQSAEEDSAFDIEEERETARNEFLGFYNTQEQ